MRSLREGVGLTQVDLADKRGVTQSAQSDTEKVGSKSRLDTLIDAAAAAGGRIEIVFRR